MRLEKSVILYGMHQIPIKIGNTQKSATGDLLHMCCQLCDSKVNQKYHCSNEKCSNHELIEKAASNTNRYFQQDKEPPYKRTTQFHKGIWYDGGSIR